MRALLIATLLTSTAAHATTIFPNGGKVEQTPNLWISSDHMPSIEVIGESGPILYEVDESLMEHGLRRFSLRPQAADGPFTVKLDGRAIRFEADASLDHADDDGFTNVEFTQVAIRSVRGRDTLVIDALAEPHTVLYFLNHSSQRSSDDKVFARYVWSGPGRVISEKTVRFELPLAELGVSCASAAIIELSPYTTHVSGSTTLHPIATLSLKAGKVALPVELVGDFTDQDTWVACRGAVAHRVPEPVVEPEKPSAILMSPTGSGSLEGFDDNALGGLCGPREHRLALPPALTPAIDGVSGDETELVWWTAPLGLLGIGLAMWRATSRAAA